MQYGRLELTSETALVESELFQGLTPDQVDRLASLATTVTAEPKDHLFKSGEAASHFYVVLQGEIEFHMDVPAWWGIDTPHRKVSTAKPGQILGWSALVEPYTYSLTAICTEKATLARFDGAQTIALIEAEPHMGRVLLARALHVVSRRFHTLAEAIMAQRAVQVSQSASRAT